MVKISNLDLEISYQIKSAEQKPEEDGLEWTKGLKEPASWEPSHSIF